MQSWQQHRNNHKLSPEQQQNRGTWQYTVRNGGVILRRNGGESFYPACSIGNVHTTQTLTIIPLNGGGSILIPHRGIAPDDYAAFMQSLANLFAPPAQTDTARASEAAPHLTAAPTQEHVQVVGRA